MADVSDVRDIYRPLPKEPDIVAREGATLRTLERAAARNQSDVEDAAYLARMTALVSKDAGWCERVPDDLSLAGQQQRLRDGCMFTLAIDSRVSDLRWRIRIRPYPIERADELPRAREHTSRPALSRTPTICSSPN